MATFTIDSDNDITGYAPGETVPDGSTELFTTESELLELAAHRPAARLVEVWNHIRGLKPVRKFTSRKTAVVWIALELFSVEVSPESSRVSNPIDSNT
jgi:hypothetical protein